MKGILGRKVGMTEVFTKEGKVVPVTVIEVEPNVVTQVNWRIQRNSIRRLWQKRKKRY